MGLLTILLLLQYRKRYELLQPDHFEEQEIITAILSLGSAITVMEPPEFKDKIHHIYQQSYQQFCD